MLHVITLFVVACLTSLLTFTYYHLNRRYQSQRWLPWPDPSRSVLSATSSSPLSASTAKRLHIGFVFAHPDDETLFFLPTILHCLHHQLPVSLLCLSTGNADGLGRTRQKEMLALCHTLSLSTDALLMVDDERLQDGLRTSWPLKPIADRVDDWRRQRGVDCIVTFDGSGVSGHPNHCAIHHAISELCYATTQPARATRCCHCHYHRSTCQWLAHCGAGVGVRQSGQWLEAVWVICCLSIGIGG